MNHKKKKKKKNFFTIVIYIYIYIKHLDNLHFISNNIFTKVFKELTKYKNDYQQYFNYICKDSICNDPNMVLSSHVKGPNNKICRAWA